MDTRCFIPKDRNKKAYEKYNTDLSTLKLAVDKAIITFINYDKDCKNNIKAQKEIGDKAGIITVLGQLSTEKRIFQKI